MSHEVNDLLKERIFEMQEEKITEMLGLLKEINWAFYVDGTPKALRAVMLKTKPLIHKIQGHER